MWWLLSTDFVSIYFARRKKKCADGTFHWFKLLNINTMHLLFVNILHIKKYLSLNFRVRVWTNNHGFHIIIHFPTIVRPIQVRYVMSNLFLSVNVCTYQFINIADECHAAGQGEMPSIFSVLGISFNAIFLIACSNCKSITIKFENSVWTKTSEPSHVSEEQFDGVSAIKESSKHVFKFEIPCLSYSSKLISTKQRLDTTLRLQRLHCFLRKYEYRFGGSTFGIM